MCCRHVIRRLGRYSTAEIVLASDQFCEPLDATRRISESIRYFGATVGWFESAVGYNLYADKALSCHKKRLIQTVFVLADTVTML